MNALLLCGLELLELSNLRNVITEFSRRHCLMMKVKEYYKVFRNSTKINI